MEELIKLESMNVWVDSNGVYQLLLKIKTTKQQLWKS
jgi:hypothetical protein